MYGCDRKFRLPNADRNRPGPRTRRQAYGRARRRQLRRQRRKHWLSGALRLFALLWLLSGALLPFVMHQYTNTKAATVESVSQEGSLGQLPVSTAIFAGEIAASPTSSLPTRTATPTLLPTATPTPTALPERLIQATAWQATLDQAAGFSHATQTQAAGQYAATQTALPAILTANAIERNATATAAVR